MELKIENFSEKNSDNIELCAVSQDENSGATECGLNEGGSAKLWYTNHDKLSTRCATIDLTDPWEQRISMNLQCIRNLMKVCQAVRGRRCKAPP